MAAPAELSVGGESYEIFRLDALQASHDVARLPYTLRILLENVLRTGDDEDVEAVAGWVATDEPSKEISFSPGRVLMQDLTGVPALVDLTAMRDAMRPRRRPGEDQPADPGRARDRPLGAGRRVRLADRLLAQRRARVRAQPRALRVPALGPGWLRQLQGRAARDRDLPPGQPRVSRAGRRDARRAGLPRHARRHRLAHDDGQRPRGARLGRWGDRGGGGDARPAAVYARPAGRRLQAFGRVDRGRDRDRPRPHRDADPAPEGSRWEVRRVLRARARAALDRRPGHDREHVTRVRRNLRLLPRRGRDPALPADDRPRRAPRRARRGLLQGEHALARPRRRADLLAGRRARPRDRGAVARGAAPPPGSRAARQGEERLHRVAR